MIILKLAKKKFRRELRFILGKTSFKHLVVAVPTFLLPAGTNNIWYKKGGNYGLVA